MPDEDFRDEIVRCGACVQPHERLISPPSGRTGELAAQVVDGGLLVWTVWEGGLAFVSDAGEVAVAEIPLTLPEPILLPNFSGSVEVVATVGGRAWVLRRWSQSEPWGPEAELTEAWVYSFGAESFVQVAEQRVDGYLSLGAAVRDAVLVRRQLVGGAQDISWLSLNDLTGEIQSNPGADVGVVRIHALDDDAAVVTTYVGVNVVRRSEPSVATFIDLVGPLDGYDEPARVQASYRRPDGRIAVLLAGGLRDAGAASLAQIWAQRLSSEGTPELPLPGEMLNADTYVRAKEGSSSPPFAEPLSFAEGDCLFWLEDSAARASAYRFQCLDPVGALVFPSPLLVPYATSTSPLQTFQEWASGGGSDVYTAYDGNVVRVAFPLEVDWTIRVNTCTGAPQGPVLRWASDGVWVAWRENVALTDGTTDYVAKVTKILRDGTYAW